MSQEPVIRLAAPADRERIRALLDQAGLPSADLETSGVVLLLAEAEGEMLGCAGIEPRGDLALLRSLAVREAAREKGLGRSLARRAENLARAAGVTTLYLLTTTAEHFWSRLGYARLARADMPREIQESAEFSALCPASAVCMKLELGATDADVRAIDEGAPPIDPAEVRQSAEKHFVSGLYCAETAAREIATARAASPA